MNKGKSLLFNLGHNFTLGNIRPHVTWISLLKLPEFGYKTLLHPPYSPEFSPTDYHFFQASGHFFTPKT